MNPIIVGIDPGTTSAFAVLSLDFKLLKIKSKRNYPFSEIIYDILQIGTPLIVGSDKKDMQGMIKEFSQKTGAKIHLTKYNTKKDEKKSIVTESGFSGLVHNLHESDSLAAAIYAYLDYKKLIEKTQKILLEENKMHLMDKVILKSILEDKSIRYAIEELEKKPDVKIIPKAKVAPLIKEISSEEQEIKTLKRLLKQKEYEIKLLETENTKLRNKKIDIKTETKKIISFKEQRALNFENENNNLKNELQNKEKIISNLNEFISISNNRILLKRLEHLQNDEFQRANKIIRISKGDILYINDLTAASKNIITELKKTCEYIIYDKGNSLDEFVCIKNNFNMIKNKHFALITKIEFEEALKDVKKNPSFFKDILDDYKRERLKEII